MSLSTSEQMQVLMDLNKVSYSPPVDGSLSNRKQWRKYAFQPLNYNSGQIAQIQINSGSDYISGPTSYISLDLTFLVEESKWNAVDGHAGSAFNIFSEYQHSHRSGDLIDRTDRINVLVSTLVSYISLDYRNSLASVFAYGSDTTSAVGATKSYVYPMFLFSGLFSQKALIPAQLMAGSRIKLQLENPKTALVGTANSDYKVTNMNLVLDSVDLFDSAKKALLEQSANVRTSGLQYSYHSWFHLAKQEGTSQLNFDINYSAAKTITLLVKSRLTAEIEDITKNSMNALPYHYTKWRMRIGALTMPEFEVENSVDSYLITTNSLGTAENDDLLERHHNTCGVKFSEYGSTATGVHSVIAQSLEKNPIVGLSGEVTNNSRQLNFSASTSDSPRTYDAYLKHLRVVNIMMDNIVVNR